MVLSFHCEQLDRDWRAAESVAKHHGLNGNHRMLKKDLQQRIKRNSGISVIFVASCSIINPVQPEAMDVVELINTYRGKLSFHGGLSTQRTLSGGTPEDVRQETRHLLELGSPGSYVFAPAHAVEGDTTLENMLAFLEEIQSQSGYREFTGTASAG